MAREVYPKFTNDHGVPEIRIGVRAFKCIGASPPQDHPHIYLEMREQDDSILCPYCATRFRFDRGLDPFAADPADSVFARALSPNRDGLAGVIDFGDVGLGNPADDLKGFWLFGAAAALHVLEGYAGRSGDPLLLERSRRAYLRYRIDRFAELLYEDGPELATADAGRLHGLLAGIPDH